MFVCLLLCSWNLLTSFIKSHPAKCQTVIQLIINNCYKEWKDDKASYLYKQSKSNSLLYIKYGIFHKTYDLLIWIPGRTSLLNSPGVLWEFLLGVLQTKKCCFPHPYSDLAPVVQKLESAIHRINHYAVDKYWQNQLCYPVDSDLSDG